jgi:hypothetical protein
LEELILEGSERIMGSKMLVFSAFATYVGQYWRPKFGQFLDLEIIYYKFWILKLRTFGLG